MPRLPPSSNITTANTSSNTLRELNELMTEYEHEVIYKLNINVIKQDPNPGNTYRVKHYSLNPNWQEIPNNSDAVQLRPTTAGHISEVLVPRHTLVCREFFGYTTMSRLVIDFNYIAFKNFMDVYVQSMISSLIELKGVSPSEKTTGQCYITFERPGSRNEYFQSLPYSSGFELRAYSDCVRTNIYIPNETHITNAGINAVVSQVNAQSGILTHTEPQSSGFTTGYINGYANGAITYSTDGSGEYQ